MNFEFLIFPELEELDLVGPWEKYRSGANLLRGLKSA
jgi:hypothetical protein